MATLSFDNWVLQAHRRKWRFVCKTALLDDYRWTKKVMQRPPNVMGKRRVGRPCCRWSDEFVQAAGGDWFSCATDIQLWGILCESSFVYAIGMPLRPSDPGPSGGDGEQIPELSVSGLSSSV